MDDCGVGAGTCASADAYVDDDDGVGVVLVDRSWNW